MSRKWAEAWAAVIMARSLAEGLAGGVGVGFGLGLGAMDLAFAGSALGSGAQAGESVITCINPASGTQWQIRVDYDHRTVDSNPASFSDGNISWHDASDGGNYTLDRKSGNLTVVVASSTGGYFLYDRCKLDN
jgi:hypothetical protein